MEMIDSEQGYFLRLGGQEGKKKGGDCDAQLDLKYKQLYVFIHKRNILIFICLQKLHEFQLWEGVIGHRNKTKTWSVNECSVPVGAKVEMKPGKFFCE